MERNRMNDMKRIKYTYLTLALAAAFASCSSEQPFTEERLDGEGRLLTSAIAVELKSEEKLVRASAAPDVNDFTVEFLNTGNLDTPVVSYRYGEMPEVVTLPVGDYIARAYFGGEYGADGSTAAFSAPYYKGESVQFSIEENKITDNIGTVECSLANVKVTILFDENLVKVMSEDSKVTVNVGEKGTLSFTKNTDESGYFHYDEGSNTISAIFSGIVDGDDTTESKSYNNVQPGNHYRITFKLHSVDPNEPGEITPGAPGDEIKIDATVQLEDLTGEGTNAGDPSDDDIYMVDDRYPSEGDPEPGPDDPGNNPDNPDTPESGPTVTPYRPDGASGTMVDLDKVNNADGLVCALRIESQAEGGFTEFTVDIESEQLSAAELEGIGLAQHLDLADTPDNLAGGLSGLGFPTNVKGMSSVEFNITGFMPMLCALGSGVHTFVLKISDASGTITKELKIEVL